MLTTKRLKSIEGLSYDNTASLRLPTGLTYHQLILTGGGDLDVTVNVAEIRLVLNGKPVSTWKGSELVRVMKHEKRTNPATSNALIIDFEKYGMLTRQGRIQTALGTGVGFDPKANPFPVTTAFLEIDLVSATDHDTTPALTAKAVQSPGGVTGVIKKMRRFNYSAPGAGDFEIDNLPKGDLINRIFILSDKCNSLVVERDSYVLFDRTKAENDLIQTDGVRAPAADMYVFDPGENGYSGEGLATRYPPKADGTPGDRVQDLRLRLGMTAADDFVVLVEYIGALGN